MMLLSRHERHQQSFEHQKRAQSTASPDQTSIHVNDLAHVDVDVPVEKVWCHLQLSPTGFTQKTWMLEKIQINHPTYPTQKNNIIYRLYHLYLFENGAIYRSPWNMELLYDHNTSVGKTQCMLNILDNFYFFSEKYKLDCSKVFNMMGYPGHSLC